MDKASEFFKGLTPSFDSREFSEVSIEKLQEFERSIRSECEAEVVSLLDKLRNNTASKRVINYPVESEIVAVHSLCARNENSPELEKKCQRCNDHPAQPEHDCTYAMKIKGGDRLCNCCEACQYECAMNV